MIIENLKFSKDHEWAHSNTDGTLTVGISQYATEELGDIVFVDLPNVGSSVQQYEKFGEIESVKAVSDLFSPLTGIVVASNDGLSDSPELVNDSPYGSGWLIKISTDDFTQLDGLMTSVEYTEYTESK